ncbi:hypothetical protein PG993_002369 [Apiospora rasikravindrae]|uniref:PWI domain-containing protein n=1 Tax=Apiospora rasikravindrae TaxID=990691 RepID=A0ABR1TWF6_9PEZI
MSYNPYGGVPGFGPPPTYNSYPGANGAPPGMPSAPGLANRPSGLPTSFQAPPNMPNINFNAPVIRLGTLPAKPATPGMPSRRESEAPMSSGGPNRPGIGMERGGLDQTRQAIRDNMQALIPPTKEELIRTMFVQGITDSIGGNDGIEQMLKLAGNLRKWDRATDAHGKDMTFGFAQFEDAESLWVASELLKEIHIPTKKQAPSGEAPPDEDDETYEKFDKSTLQFKLDENSINYLEAYNESRGSEGDAKLEAARGALKQMVRKLFYPPAKPGADADGDVAMGDAAGQSGENVEVVNIPLAQDDELADIPAEMRETVAAEIAAFRERSIKRDLERLKREEELEALERQRANGTRASRMTSPPPNNNSNSNNIPLGPRGAPSGPKSQKTDLGKDYNRSVNFVNGGTTNGGLHPNRDDDETDASDDELEKRRVAKQNAETEKLYLDAERRWLNRERSRAAALEREKDRDDSDEANIARKREELLERFKHFDDDAEATRKKEEYFADRSAWIRNRTAFRAREIAADDADRAAEERERAKEAAEQEQARGMADSFLERQAQEMQQREDSRAAMPAPQPFKLSLGAAAQRAQAQRAAPQRKTIAEVEGLLEDEEEDSSTRRQLVPIKFEPMAAAGMSDEEREQAVRALAQEIPSEKEGLWEWDVKWDFLDETVIRDKLRPFVEKKLVEYLGVQEELLIEVVEEHLRKHSKPAEVVEELAEALDDEAEALVKKLWRMVIFFTESEKRGLSA